MPTLVQRKNGIWTVVFSYQGRRVWRSTGTKKHEVAELIAEDIGREFVTPKDIRLMELWYFLLPALTGSLAPGTIKLYESAFKTFARIIGNVQICAITLSEIERFTVARLDEVSAVKVSIDFRVLRASFNRAKRMKLLDYNIFEG